jgi:hypothetical protein
LFSVEAPRKHAETDAYFTFETKIHLGHLFFFSIYNLVFRVSIGVKVSRHESERDIIEEFRLTPFSCMKEMHKFMKNILENVGRKQPPSHGFW